MSAIRRRTAAHMARSVATSPHVLQAVEVDFHAVDEAGVHPLLLAIGTERYVPYDPNRRPMELLTLANALLGYGQLSLAKYLFIVAGEDNPHFQQLDGFARQLSQRRLRVLLL